MVLSSDKVLYSKKEAAALIGICLRTLDNLISVGELRPRRIGRRVLVSRFELERFARSDHKTRAASNNGQGSGAG